MIVKKFTLVLHLTTYSRKGVRGNVREASQTTSLHRVQAPPRKSIFGVRFSDVVNTETLDEIDIIISEFVTWVMNK